MCIYNYIYIYIYLLYTYTTRCTNASKHNARDDIHGTFSNWEVGTAGAIQLLFGITSEGHVAPSQTLESNQSNKNLHWSYHTQKLPQTKDCKLTGSRIARQRSQQEMMLRHSSQWLTMDQDLLAHSDELRWSNIWESRLSRLSALLEDVGAAQSMLLFIPVPKPGWQGLQDEGDLGWSLKNQYVVT